MLLIVPMYAFFKEPQTKTGIKKIKSQYPKTCTNAEKQESVP